MTGESLSTPDGCRKSSRHRKICSASPLQPHSPALGTSTAPRSKQNCHRLEKPPKALSSISPHCCWSISLLIP